jgi:hypothetical protein
MSFTKWNPVQACVWIASRDDAVVAKLAGYNFIQLAIEVEREGDGIIGPRLGWIAAAQSELLDACHANALTMTGSSLYGGSSTAIPAAAFGNLRFHERDGADCLGPPNLADADCWCDLGLQADHVRAAFARAPTTAKALVPQRGAGNTPYSDDDLVVRVLDLVEDGKHKSKRAAALSLMHIIPGHGTPESKARRIADKAGKAKRGM